MSSGWKRLYPKPAGSLPGGIVTQWGVALITVLILVFVAIWLATGGSKQAEIDSIGGEVTGPGRNFAGQMAAQVEAESLRAETRRAAADRTLQAQQRQEARESATGAIGGGQVTMDEALLLAGPSPETGEAYTEQEFELRERLRLEALERRSRSLRSSPVAQTYRQLDRARSPTEAEAEPGPVEAIRAEGAAALSQALGTFQGVTGSLEDEIAAEAVSDQAFLAALTGAQRGGGSDPAQSGPPGPAAPAALAPDSLGFPGAAAQPARDYANPPRLEGGDDPPGWERIYEGSFLEAVLVTQLSGDFPGPVLAQVRGKTKSGCRAVLLRRPPAGFSPAWSAGDRNRVGSSGARPRAAGRVFPSVDLPGRAMGHAQFSRPQPGGRRRVERSGEPPLFLDVRGCRRGWHH